MPRQCTICGHPAREAVERDLVASVPVSHVAAEYGLAASSIHRHKSRHLAPRLTRALARQEDIDADKLAGLVLGLQDKTMIALAQAETARDFPAIRGVSTNGERRRTALTRA